MVDADLAHDSGVALAQLVARDIAQSLNGDGSTRVQGVQHDSRRVLPGDLFVAISGATDDGARYIEQALTRGASAVLSSQPLQLPVPTLVALNPRRSLPHAAEVVYGFPTAALKVIGITGTNGKTTTAEWLGATLGAERSSVIATTGVHGLAQGYPIHNTTPEGDDVSRIARKTLARGGEYLIMEVSSHALALHRVDAITFAVAGFTNLSQDHLDFHATLEAYGAAKARLFTERNPQHAVINADDEFGRRLAKSVPNALTYSTNPDGQANIKPLRANMTAQGFELEVRTPCGDIPIKSTLVGMHNLSNALLVMGCLIALGASASVLARVGDFTGAKGRLERIAGLPINSVFVDYAHTPDALVKTLSALRPITQGRLWVVFGAGGDRDSSKRGAMGRAAADYADVLVLTSDNPRSESPEVILSQIEQGVLESGVHQLALHQLANASHGYVSIADRALAIATAAGAMQSGDTLVVAGKGHESYQEVRGQRLPFSDEEQLHKAFARLTSPMREPAR